MYKILLLATVAITFSSPAIADSPAFSSLSKSDVENIFQDFAAVKVFTSVSPASSLGETFGFEVGLLFGAATVPNVEKLVKNTDPNLEVPALPHAALYGAVSVPYGLKFELALLPERDFSDVSLEYQAFAIQWTMTDVVLPLPVDVAVKLHRANAVLGYSQQILTVSVPVEIENTISGLQILAGKKLGFIEPYGGMGLIKVEGDFRAASGLFSYTSAGSVSSEVTGSQFFAGINMSLLFFKMGLELGRVFESNKASFKLSASF